MSNETNPSKKDNGLPDIANFASRKNIMVILLAFIVLAFILGINFYPKSHKKVDYPVEENYVTQTDVPLAPKLKVAPTPETVATEQVTQPINQEAIQQEVALIEQKQKELQQRLVAPLMLVNANQTNTTVSAPQQNQTTVKDANTQFMDQVSAQGTEVHSPQ